MLITTRSVVLDQLQVKSIQDKIKHSPGYRSPTGTTGGFVRMIRLMRRKLPSGTVTFLFTDVEGSTRLLQALGPMNYAEKVR